jgi:Gram-negative bacterial TonB protein C-terminal
VHRRKTTLIIACVMLLGACTTNLANSKRASAPSRASAGCLDTLHAADTVGRVVKLSVSPQDTTKKLPKDFESFFAQEFRRRFRVPPKLSLSVVMGMPPCDSVGRHCLAGYLDLATTAYATAHYDGTLTDIDVIDATLTPPLADSVRAALTAVSREQLAPTFATDSVLLIIRLETEQNPDTVPPLRQVFRVKVPHYSLPFTYASMPVTGVQPRYPFSARLAGVGDSVSIAFTVDAEGRIAPESLQLLRATYRDFIASVVDVLQRTQYHPARLGDCPVSTRMSQRFVFTVAQDR